MSRKGAILSHLRKLARLKSALVMILLSGMFHAVFHGARRTKMSRITSEEFVGGVTVALGIELFTLAGGEAPGTGLWVAGQGLFLLFWASVFSNAGFFLIQGIGGRILKR